MLWECQFVYSSFALGILYLLLCIIVLKFVLQLTEQTSLYSTSRLPQKLFLLLLFMQSLLRTIFFFTTPWYFQSCNRGDYDINQIFSAVLGNLPANLFLFAFTILVITFGRIYHTVVYASSILHYVIYIFLIVFLLSIDVMLLVSSILVGISAYTDVDPSVAATYQMFAVSISAFLIGIMFSSYSIGLYNYLSKDSTTNSTALLSSPAFHPYRSPRESREDTAFESNYSPMFRLMIAAIVTTLCFFVRFSILLHQIITNQPVGVTDVGQPTYLSYFIFSELVPGVLLMYSFSKLSSGMPRHEAPIQNVAAIGPRTPIKTARGLNSPLLRPNGAY